MPLDVDAVTSPRYTREPLLPSLHLIEVSHISIHKSSITLRCFNMSYKNGIIAKMHGKDIHNSLIGITFDPIWMHF